MITRELLATATIPDDNLTENKSLQLYKHGNDYMITIGNNELMNSRVYGSEQALADLSCAALRDKPSAKILIGGYGMGFTLRSALKALGPDANVIIAELIPDIIAWAKGPMESLSQGDLSDERVTLKIGDVKHYINKTLNTERYDAILLDVDNGPDGLTSSANDDLYSNNGLEKAKLALQLGGILAIWSAHPSAKFTKQLLQAGFEVQEHKVRARINGKGARHMIWIATNI